MKQILLKSLFCLSFLFTGPVSAHMTRHQFRHIGELAALKTCAQACKEALTTSLSKEGHTLCCRVMQIVENHADMFKKLYTQNDIALEKLYQACSIELAELVPTRFGAALPNVQPTIASQLLILKDQLEKHLVPPANAQSIAPRVAVKGVIEGVCQFLSYKKSARKTCPTVGDRIKGHLNFSSLSKDTLKNIGVALVKASATATCDELLPKKKQTQGQKIIESIVSTLLGGVVAYALLNNRVTPSRMTLKTLLDVVSKLFLARWYVDKKSPLYKPLNIIAGLVPIIKGSTIRSDMSESSYSDIAGNFAIDLADSYVLYNMIPGFIEKALPKRTKSHLLAPTHRRTFIKRSARDVFDKMMKTLTDASFTAAS